MAITSLVVRFTKWYILHLLKTNTFANICNAFVNYLVALTSQTIVTVLGLSCICYKLNCVLTTCRTVVFH